MMNIQQNSRPCIGNGGLKLFGVQLNTPSPPSSSTSSTSSSSSSLVSSTSSVSSSLSSLLFLTEAKTNKISAGDNVVKYLCHPSSGLVTTTNTTERRNKGIPWSEEEHGMFLVGLEKLGKGDWRGISRRFVHTRTPTQVASHAQKYFLRRNNIGKRKRRSSLFDEIESLSKPCRFSTSEDVGKIETGGTNILNLLSTEDLVKPDLSA